MSSGPVVVAPRQEPREASETGLSAFAADGMALWEGEALVPQTQAGFQGIRNALVQRSSSEQGAVVREVLHADVGLSFWGGVEPATGVVIDRTHPLFGECVAGKILCIPNGRGSSTGSQVIESTEIEERGPDLANLIPTEKSDKDVVDFIAFLEDGSAA